MRHPESDLQKACINWFRYRYSHLSKLCFSVPNGGFRNAREAARMKAEGVVAGASDIILLVGRGGYNALCIELKTEKGRQTELQREWQKEAERNGNRYVIMRSLEEFINLINNYLNNENM